MAQRPARAATKSKRPAKPKAATTVAKAERVEAATKPRAATAKAVRKQTKPAAPAGKKSGGASRAARTAPVANVAKPAAPFKRTTSKSATSKSATSNSATSNSATSNSATSNSATSKAASKPPAASKAAAPKAKASKPAPAKAQKPAPAKAAGKAKAAEKAPKAAATPRKPPRARKARPAPAYLAAELGQPVDHEGEPIGAGSPRVQEDGPLQEYALQLWRQMQSGGVVKRYLRAIERAGLTVDEVWTVGLGGEARSTSSTPDEMRRYKQRLLFRANLLEALLTETIADLHRLEGVEPTPPKAAAPEPAPSIPSEAA